MVALRVCFLHPKQIQVLDFNPDLASPRQCPLCADVGHTVPLSLTQTSTCQTFLGLQARPVSVAREPSPQWLRRACELPPEAWEQLLSGRPADDPSSLGSAACRANGFAELRPSVPPTPVGTTSPTSWQKRGVFCKTVVLLGASPPARDLLQMKTAQAASAGPLCRAGVGLMAGRRQAWWPSGLRTEVPRTWEAVQVAEQSTRCVKTRESCLTSLPGNTASPGGRVAGSRLHSPVNTHVHTRAPCLTHVFLSVQT